jgi:threonine dehydratase
LLLRAVRSCFDEPGLILDFSPPAIEDVRALQRKLQQWLVLTPVLRCVALEDYLGGALEIHGKMEFLQQTGTFKPRGALSIVSGLDADQLKAGITAVSAGNHAIAAAFAARSVGTSAKVVMTASASQARVDACKFYGAEIVLAQDVHVAFDMVEEIRRSERRYFVHPFEGKDVATGTATVGLEICEQVKDFDVAIIPVGGGGLCAGISSAIKQLNPSCHIVGVEPEGADSMHRSFASGKPETIDRVLTIADSLGAPFAMPYSFEVCRQNVDELVLVTEDQLKDAMGFLFRNMKMAVEPACAASTAALAGPLRGRFDGKKVVIVLCGSNIDWQTYERHANLE